MTESITPSEQQIHALLSSLTTEELGRMLRDANYWYAYQGEFDRRAAGLDPSVREAAWAALDFARRVSAHSLRPPSLGHPTGWYTVTPQTRRLLHDIDVLATGRLVSALERLGDEQHRFAAQALMDEAVAACLAPDEQTQIKDVRSLLRHGLEPRTRTERLVVNFYLTMQQVPKIAETPLTIESIIELQRMLSVGLSDGPDDCVAFRHRNIPRRSTVDLWPGAYVPPLAHEVQSYLARTLDELRVPEPWVPPLVRGPQLYFSLLMSRPFELDEVGLAR